MYTAALCLSPEDVYTVSLLCFIEMLRAGVTTVGEFHYLHNDENGASYANPGELAERVLEAAAVAGIRICLLNVCYATGDVGRALFSEQRRFATPDLDAYLAATDRLRRSHAGDALVTAGVAPHSVRAVPREWLPLLHTWASERALPLHMHVSEQAGEVDACVAAHGLRPVELLHEEGLLDERFTAVHATHVNDAEVRLLARSGATVCACPATERDLGDGFLRAFDLLAAGGSIALGSDSQTVIDPLEDARLVEYHERLQRRERVILAHLDDGRLDVAPRLLRMATAAGARSLHVPSGALDAGALADIVGIDLDHLSLAGWTADTLGALLLLSAPAGVVRDVWVGGRAVVTDRWHAGQEEAMQAFNHAARRVFAVA
jgi:formimidoylglutamate deiminase